MEMNFPHKDLEWTAPDKGDDGLAPFADHHSLIAQAIARQASSRSVRIFVAAERSRASGGPVQGSSFMDGRMAFFAGRTQSDMAGDKTAMLFKTGCFRPDLAQRERNEV